MRTAIYSAAFVLALANIAAFGQATPPKDTAQQPERAQAGQPGAGGTMQQRQRPEAAQQRGQKQAGQEAVTILAAPQSQILKQAQGDGCWVALYRDPNFAGQPIVIDGPISLGNVRDHVNTGWFRSFGSMQAGEKAKVTIYSNQNFESRAADVEQGQKVADLQDQKLGFFENIESLRVQC